MMVGASTWRIGATRLSGSHPRRGVAMLVVLVVMGLAAMLAAGLLYRMRAEAEASSARGRGEQAYAAATSGLERAIGVLKAHLDEPDLWLDHPEWFADQLVLDDGAERWYFTIWAPSEDDDTQIRYGLEDEAGRINLNTADPDTLLLLPGMTEERVDALVDYRDADDDPRPLGAEQSYYDHLAMPYTIKNGPLASVEELLLVRGFDGPLVWGEDVNLSGVLDANEDDGDTTFPPDDGDGQLNRGLRGLLTVYSYDLNVNREGRPRVPVTAGAVVLRSAGIPDQAIAYIELLRAEGQPLAQPADLLEAEYELKQNHDGYTAGQIVESGVGPDELAVIMDNLTAESAPPLAVGLVNVSSAPAEVLAALPGMDEELARRAVETRGGLDSETRSTIAWLYSEGVLDADEFKAAASHLTARSRQYRVRCIGFGVPSGRYRIIEAVVDLTPEGATIRYLRDITRLGLPMAIDLDRVDVGQ